MPTLQIDIVSDVMCPWCIVGYKKLQLALLQLPAELTIKLNWHPFELNPTMPAMGQNLSEHIQQKYGLTAAQSAQNRAQLVEIGNQLDFRFNFSDDSRIVNTFLAHQLIHWAQLCGKQTEIKLALFDAFFTEQQDVSELPVLLNIAAKVGLPTDKTHTVLSEQTYASEVKAAEQQWQRRGIQSVPAIVLNQQLLISGAQEPAQIIAAINELID